MVAASSRHRGGAGHPQQIVARVELLGLVVATLLTVLAVGLAVAARAGRAGEIDAEIAAGRIVALNEAPSAAALTRPLLQVWPADEAAAIAAELRTWLTGHPAGNVGALAQVEIAASRVQANPQLASARARLEDAVKRGRTAERVPLMTSGQLAVLKPSFIVRRVGAFEGSAIVSLLLVLGGFYALHALRRLTQSTADPLLLPAVHVLCGLGLTLMIGLRDPVRDLLLATPFAWGVVLGSIVAMLAWRAPVERLSLQYAPLAGAFALSILLIVFGDGPAGSDARVNLWGVQPVEAIRLLVVLYLAAFFARQWQHLRSVRDARSHAVPWLRGVAVPPFEYIVPMAAALALVGLFFAVQRDLGPALVFAVVFLSLWTISVRRGGLAITGAVALAAGFWVVVRAGFPATLATRVAMAADPWMNAQPGGNQIAHAFWALASGGALGAGPGMGDPQYVPAGHTDLVLAVLGEEFGFIGLAAAAAAYAVLCHRALRIAMRAPTDFSCFLALGLTLAMFAQLALIAGGCLGLLPLSGVVTPFLSYGRSAMAANFCAIGVLLAISSSSTPSPRPAAVVQFQRPLSWVTACLAMFAVLVVGRAFHAQVSAADETMAASALVRLADGGLRFEDNPRLLAAARQHLGRGDIVDRNGVIVATSEAAHLTANAKALARVDVDAATACRPGDARCYPLGGRLYHVLGDANTELDWRASNTSFIERDSVVRLQGYNDFERPVSVEREGASPIRVRKRRYDELVPLVRYRYRPGHSSVRALQERPRDLRLSIDARLQVKVASLLRRGVEAAGSTHGAAAVMDARSGDVLAAVSYPWPDAQEPFSPPPDHEARLDRMRYGVYPPGSTFKLVTAAATLALRPELGNANRMCVRLPDGRAGVHLPGRARPIRDDALDTQPHAHLGLDEALRVSCNAYFAQLALALGPEALFTMASRFDIEVARPNTARRLREQLPYAGFGQGETLVTPMRILSVAATIAAGGERAPFRWLLDDGTPEPAVRVMSTQAANRLARDMAAAVATGTGRHVAGVRPAIAGKTGTAEVSGAASHAWFTGFAPASGRGRRLAFVVLVENGGYGGRAAAPIAGQIVSAARELRLFQGDEE